MLHGVEPHWQQPMPIHGGLTAFLSRQSLTGPYPCRLPHRPIHSQRPVAAALIERLADRPGRRLRQQSTWEETRQPS